MLDTWRKDQVSVGKGLNRAGFLFLEILKLNDRKGEREGGVVVRVCLEFEVNLGRMCPEFRVLSRWGPQKEK